MIKVMPVNKRDPTSLDHRSIGQSATGASANGSTEAATGRGAPVCLGLEPILGAVYRIVEAWAPLFTPPLTGEVVITVQPGRGKRLGWFACNRWRRSDTGQTLPEINLCADRLAGELFEVADTVIHELAHYANWQLGISDCSSSQYHKRSFKDKAESVGLVCLPWDKSKGWAFTDLSAEARARIDGLGIDPKVFSLFRPRLGRHANKPLKMRRWQCGNQTVLCRPVWRAAGTDLQAVCLACGMPFVKSD